MADTFDASVVIPLSTHASASDAAVLTELLGVWAELRFGATSPDGVDAAFAPL